MLCQQHAVSPDRNLVCADSIRGLVPFGSGSRLLLPGLPVVLGHE